MLIVVALWGRTVLSFYAYIPMGETDFRFIEAQAMIQLAWNKRKTKHGTMR